MTLCISRAVVTFLVGVALLSLTVADAHASILIYLDPGSVIITPGETVTALVKVSTDMDVNVTNIDIAMGLVRTKGSGTVTIASVSVPADSIWDSPTLLVAPPPLPQTSSIIDIFQFVPGDPNGSVFQVTFDATDAVAGDRFSVDLNYLGNSTFGDLLYDRTDLLEFLPATIEIVPEPFSFLVWGLLGCACTGFFRWRKRRRFSV